MKPDFYSFFCEQIVLENRLIAILIDPDKFDANTFKTALKTDELPADLILVGGSILTEGSITETIKEIKKISSKPVFIFPGSSIQISNGADGIFFLSLISGRNPDYLIGQHVLSAPILKKSSLEIISTGYILIDGGQATSVSYMSNTTPIPYNKPEIAACTAMAGELLGMKQIYLEAGSGALVNVNTKVIEAVKKSISIPLIVGGGINSIQKAEQAFNAGANMIVVGTAIEDNPNFLSELLAYKNKLKNRV